MQRSIIAVIAGFVLTFALNMGTSFGLAALSPAFSARPLTDPAWLIGICAYVGVFGIVGCYVTARLAPSRPLLHALIMGGIALAMSIPMTISMWNDAPAWFNVYNLLAVMPYAWIGGTLRERELVRAGHGRLAAAS